MYYGNKINSQVIDRVCVKNPYKKEEVILDKEEHKNYKQHLSNINWKMVLGYGGLALFFVSMIIAIHLIV